MSPVNLYAVMTIFSSLMIAPFAFAIEGTIKNFIFNNIDHAILPLFRFTCYRKSLSLFIGIYYWLIWALIMHFSYCNIRISLPTFTNY